MNESNSNDGNSHDKHAVHSRQRISKRGKKPAKKICATVGCGVHVRQKYYRICVKCRQARKRKKKEDREIRRVVKEAFK